MKAKAKEHFVFFNVIPPSPQRRRTEEGRAVQEKNLRNFSAGIV